MTDKKIDFEQYREELLKMEQVSQLIGEVRPYFIEKRKREKSRAKKLSVACAALFLLFFGVGTTALNYEYDIMNTIVYHNLSAEDMGFPTDEYGLIMVE